MSASTITADQPVTQLDVQHLSITQTWDSGRAHSIHLTHDPDLAVKLGRGGEPIGDFAENLVLVALDLDEGDHDTVLVDADSAPHTLEALRRAIETLQAAESALTRVRAA